VATGTENYFNNPGFADLEKKTDRYFVQDSVNPGTLGSEVVQGEFAIDDSLVAFDTSPVFTDYSQPNNPEVPEVETATVETATTVKTIRGANYDVINSKERALSNITFIPGTACAMSEAIAYIRYWSRKGTQQKQPVDQEPQNGKPTDAQKALQDEMNQKYFSSADEYLVNPEFGSGEVTGSETRVIAKVPDNTAYQSRPRQPVPTRVPVPATISQPLSGNTYSANPSGALATTPFIIPAEAVWTFLFNPEELQLSSGPDFNRAETWGVSDQANSGQPLSWRSNKNRKLTFSKVLLHGYSFGKRVDSLERGLQELFTARDGENGADGPPVLEFVWGKRVFGPCVIQNVQVREKAWDNGLLVNAEVSFDLEQVPEWTINDGFVDVLRPGRQSTVNDPLVPASTAEAGATPEDEEKKKNDDKKTPDGGKPVNIIQDCQKFYNFKRQFNELEFALKQLKNKPLPLDPRRGPSQGRPISNIYKILPVLGGTFTVTGNSNISSKVLVEAIDKLIKIRESRECNPDTYEQTYEYSIEQAYRSRSNVSSQIKDLDNKHTDIAIKCIRSYKKVADDAIKIAKCAPSAIPSGKKQGPGLF
jgi:hypothetical protein